MIGSGRRHTLPNHMAMALHMAFFSGCADGTDDTRGLAYQPFGTFWKASGEQFRTRGFASASRRKPCVEPARGARLNCNRRSTLLTSSNASEQFGGQMQARKQRFPQIEADREREAFTQRLRLALHNAGYEPSATRLSREFNLRSQGLSVTVYAAHKWLNGDAIPTQPNLQALSTWLEVRPEWLRFGSNGFVKAPFKPRRPLSSEYLVAAQMSHLDDHDQQMVVEFAQMLRRLHNDGKS